MATVKELIGALRNFDENQEVFVWDGDNNIPLDKHFLSLFDSDDIQNENNPLAINIECFNKKLKEVELGDVLMDEDHIKDVTYE